MNETKSSIPEIRPEVAQAWRELHREASDAYEALGGPEVEKAAAFKKGMSLIVRGLINFYSESEEPVQEAKGGSGYSSIPPEVAEVWSDFHHEAKAALEELDPNFIPDEEQMNRQQLVVNGLRMIIKSITP